MAPLPLPSHTELSGMSRELKMPDIEKESFLSNLSTRIHTIPRAQQPSPREGVPAGQDAPTFRRTASRINHTGRDRKTQILEGEKKKEDVGWAKHRYLWPLGAPSTRNFFFCCLPQPSVLRNFADSLAQSGLGGAKKRKTTPTHSPPPLQSLPPDEHDIPPSPAIRAAVCACILSDLRGGEETQQASSAAPAPQCPAVPLPDPAHLQTELVRTVRWQTYPVWKQRAREPV